MLARSVCAVALLLCSCAAPRNAAPPNGSTGFVGTALPYKLGSTMARDGADCSISASAPPGSPLKKQQLRFVVNRNNPGMLVTQEFRVSTGASKSQSEVEALLGSGFRRSTSAPVGAELAKLGDIKYGGEMRLMSRGGGNVEVAFNPPNADGNPQLSAAEAAAFAQLLGK